MRSEIVFHHQFSDYFGTINHRENAFNINFYQLVHWIWYVEHACLFMRVFRVMIINITAFEENLILAQMRSLN